MKKLLLTIAAGVAGICGAVALNSDKMPIPFSPQQKQEVAERMKGAPENAPQKKVIGKAPMKVQHWGDVYPESVELLNSEINIVNINSGYTLELVYTPDSEEVNGEMTWTYSHEGIVRIEDWGDSYGIVGLDFGTTEFTGTTPNGLTVTGTATVSGIKITSGDYLDITVGDTFEVDYTTSSPEIADAVEIYYDDTMFDFSDGKFTALKYGETWINVEAHLDGEIYYTSVLVSVHPETGLVITPEKSNLTPSDWIWLKMLSPIDTCYEGTWNVSDESVLKITEANTNNCCVEAVGYGTADVIFTTTEGLTAFATVAATPNIEDLYVISREITLYPGATAQIDVVTVPENIYQNIIYESEDENVATVDETGLITAVGYGHTVIRVRSEYGWSSDLVNVTVASAPESVTLNNPELLITSFGTTYDLDIIFGPNDDNVSRDMTWEYSRNGIVEVKSSDIYVGDDENGNSKFVKYYYVEPVGLGETDITGTTINGLKVTGHVTTEGVCFLFDRNSTLTLSEPFSVNLETSSPEIRDALYFNYDHSALSFDGSNITPLKCGYFNFSVSAFVSDTYYQDVCYLSVHPEAGAVALSQTQLSLLEGQNRRWIEVLFPVDTYYEGTWTSSDENVVQIVEPYAFSCYFNTIEAGTATLSYTTTDGISASCEVNVYKRVESLTLTASSEYLGLGETVQIVPEFTPADSAQPLNYTSSNTDVATVNENGIVTAVGYGDATIRGVPVAGGRTASISVHVANMPTSVTLNNPEIDFTQIGHDAKLDLTFTPDEEGVSRDIEWTFAEEGIAEINRYDEWFDKEGNPLDNPVYSYYIISKDLGSTEFTGVTPNGIEVKGRVSVAGIKFTPDYTDITEGESFNLTVETTSEEIASAIEYQVSDGLSFEGGVVTAITPGYNNINASAVVDGIGYTAFCSVTVHPTEGVIFGYTDRLCYVGEGFSLNAIFPIGEFSVGEWAVSDENVLGIDYSNLNYAVVMTKGPGNATVTFTTEDGYTATCNVIVCAFAESIYLDVNEIKLTQIGETCQLTAITEPAFTNQQNDWRSSDTAVATVDENGLVTAMGEGTAFVRTYALDKDYNWLEAYCKVTVDFTSGVDAIFEESDFDIYSTSGILLKKGASKADFEQLQPGIYLLNDGTRTVKAKR